MDKAKHMDRARLLFDVVFSYNVVMYVCGYR
jgi:hypothetical protein